MPKPRSRRRTPSGSHPQSSRRPSGPRSAIPRTPRAPLVRQPAPGVRGKVERMTAPVLVYLSSLPRAVLPIASVVLLITGLAAPAVIGVPAMLLVIALIGWLTYVSWPAVQGVQRLLRLAVVGLLLAALLARLTT